MTKYIKPEINRQEHFNLCNKYGLSPLEAAIFARRKITAGEEIKYFLEDNQRFMHEPFLLNNMEDAVERINQAIEEKEKVLIFGDKDVDGITSTAILYTYLKQNNLEVQWRLPQGNDSYGLSTEAIDDFMKNTDGFGSLIITVDCGISNNIEIAHANELGIDVIVTDHHNPPEILPDASIIIDPKLPDSRYPFKDISGAAVAYKLVQALRFSKLDIYGQDITLMEIHESENPNEEFEYTIECLKTKNLTQKSKFSMNIKPGEKSIYDTKLIDFLRSQQIFVWNEKETRDKLRTVFGSGVEFQIFDIQKEMSKTLPFVSSKSLAEIQKQSTIAKYSDKPFTKIDAFFNIYVTYVKKYIETTYPQDRIDSDRNLQLVAIAALADIMPLKNENRIFVKNALTSMNRGKFTKGIAELIARTDLVTKTITATDLSWNIIPLLNAPGRLGKSNLSISLLLEEDAAERNRIADEIQKTNDQRKQFEQEAEILTAAQAKNNFAKYNEKLCIVYDEKIVKGITGILANQIMKKYNVPAIVLTLNDDKKCAVGSMRSSRGVIATDFLGQFKKDFFINYGGHNAAAGFSFIFNNENLKYFFERALEISKELNLSENSEKIIDAEIDSTYMNFDLVKLSDRFEPYGEQNERLTFCSKNIKISEASIFGKTERQHLKLVFNCEKNKFPSIFWGEGSRLGKDFTKEDSVDIIYNIEKKYYAGNESPQLKLIDIAVSSQKKFNFAQ